MADSPSPDPGSNAPARLSPKDLLLALRPSQWTKNLVVLAAFFFAYWDLERPHQFGWSHLEAVLAGALLFCLVSSGVYVLNDIRDRPLDRNHPIRRNRPIAAGRIPIPLAWLVSLVLLAGGALAAWVLRQEFFIVVASYILLQVAYTFVLKRIAFVDIFVIAAGFVLRAIAGAVVVDVHISPWLLLCTFLLALFLAICKRRHEKVLVANLESDQRPTLEHYDQRVVDLMVAIASASTIVSYAMYTLSPETVRKFGTSALGFTIPFVVFGIFRYLDLVYRHRQGGRPERILLTDLPTLVNVVLYAGCVVVIFLLKR